MRYPEMFLFDEPLSNLDAMLRVKMRLELAKLHKDMKTTMVNVTHDQVEAMTLADQIVVLEKGHNSAGRLTLAVAQSARHSPYRQLNRFTGDELSERTKRSLDAGGESGTR